VQQVRRQARRLAAELEGAAGNAGGLAIAAGYADWGPVMASWCVDYQGKKLQHLGMVEADTDSEAVEKAAKLFSITPARRFKISVEKVEIRKKT
jgi:hypothetical protein